MNNYVITVYSAEKTEKGTKPKTKTIVCFDDKEMFSIVQNAMDDKLTYEVYKAELELVLGNREQNPKA